jgi:hypothetical protein
MFDPFERTNVVATKVTVHMKISPDEASATWKIINFRNRSHGQNARRKLTNFPQDDVDRIV